MSVNPPGIPEIKAKIGSVNKSEVQAIANAVLKLDSAAKVREYDSSMVWQPK